MLQLFCVLFRFSVSVSETGDEFCFERRGDKHRALIKTTSLCATLWR